MGVWILGPCFVSTFVSKDVNTCISVQLLLSFIIFSGIVEILLVSEINNKFEWQPPEDNTTHGLIQVRRSIQGGVYCCCCLKASIPLQLSFPIIMIPLLGADAGQCGLMWLGGQETMGIVLDIHERICMPPDAVHHSGKALPPGWIMR
jgi:hypothetical protein